MNYTIEKNLFQGLRNREDAAFEHLRKTCFQAVCSITNNSSQSREDAEDLYNDGIIILYFTAESINESLALIRRV